MDNERTAVEAIFYNLLPPQRWVFSSRCLALFVMDHIRAVGAEDGEFDDLMSPDTYDKAVSYRKQMLELLGDSCQVEPLSAESLASFEDLDGAEVWQYGPADSETGWSYMARSKSDLSSLPRLDLE